MWNPFGGKKKPEAEPVRMPEPAVGPDLAAVFAELLVKLPGLTPGGFKGFLMGRRVSDGALAGWLGQHPGAAGLEELRGLGRLGGEVGRVALGLVREQSPEPESKRVDGDGSDASVEDLIAQSVNAFQVGDYQLALQCVETAVQRYPNSRAAWFSRGDLMSVFGQHGSAIESYDQAIAIEPDYHEAWFRRGNSLANLGRGEEAIESWDQAIAIKPDYHEALFLRGDSLANLGRGEEVIESWDQAIEIKPDYHEVLFLRGLSLSQLGREEEAIESYEKAIEIKPDFHDAWYIRGFSLSQLGREEEAIESCEKAIEHKPDYHDAWFVRGVSLDNLGRNEEAIASYEKAIEYKLDYYEAWNNRGVSLSSLGRKEEAIESYEKAIEYKPDGHEAWYGRGLNLNSLGRNEAAIESYDQAIAIKPDDHEAWTHRGFAALASKNTTQIPGSAVFASPTFNLPHPSNPSAAQQFNNPDLNQRGIPGQLASLTEGLRHCPSPIGQGFLYRALGDVYRDRCFAAANQGPSNLPAVNDAWRKAHRAYNQSLAALALDSSLSAETLLTLLGLLRMCLFVGDLPVAREIQIQCSSIFEELRRTSYSPRQLARQFSSFNRLEIDLIICEDHPHRALEQAELYKNRTLTWILDGCDKPDINPSYPQLRELLTPTTAILYWHLSQDALTTFILTPDNPEPIVLDTNRRLQAYKLHQLLTDYKRDYASYTALPKDAPNRHLHPWRKQLADRLTKLRDILAIDQILPHITNASHLILLPHRDLHLLPLQPYFDIPSTTLPSLQIGLNLPTNLPKNQSPDLLIEDPDLLYSTIESAILRTLLANHPTPRDLTYLPGDHASHSATLTALEQPHRLFHFSGHGSHNSRNPDQSAIGLADQNLTAKTIASLDLSPYDLISLAACETGITSTATDATTDLEYIGLASAFLKAKARTVLSTLWRVDDELSSLWIIIRFYEVYLAGSSPAEALAIAQTWLKTQTYQALRTDLQTLQQLPNLGPRWRKELVAQEQLWVDNLGKIGPEERPYADPFHWAGFTLAGLTADSTHERI